MYKVCIAVLIVTVTMIVIFQCIDPSIETNIDGVTTTLVDSSLDSISVSIEGEVVREGTYLVDVSSTLEDLIEVASGVTTNADELAYDTSYLLEDGMSFYIAPKYDNSDVCSLEPIKKVNINEDDAETLSSVSGIGSATSKAIVSYRENNGAYGRLEDIKNVSGIGNATFEKIKNYLVLRSA